MLKPQYFGHLIWKDDSGKDPDAGKDWRQEKGTTEDEMVGWHHGLDGHELEQAPGIGEGQGTLACCSPWSNSLRHHGLQHARCPKYWSFSFSISPSNEHPGLISFRMDWLDLLAVQGTLKSLLSTTVQKHQIFGAQLSSQSNPHIHTWPLEKP